MEETMTAKFTGGAGSTTNPLCDDDYEREMDKLMAINAADGDSE